MADLLAKRFNKTQVNEMARYLAEQSFDQKLAKINQNLKHLADKLFDSFMAKDLKLIESLPKGWLEEIEVCRVKFLDGENDVYVSIAKFRENDDCLPKARIENRSNQCLGIPMSASKRIPHKLRYTNFPIQQSSSEGKEIINLYNEYASVQLEKYEFKEQMISLMTNLKTFKALYEFWPEVRELLKEFEPTEPVKVMLPSVPLNDFNKLLGIPKPKTITATS